MRHLTLSLLEFRRRWLAMPVRMRAMATLMIAAAIVLFVLVWGQATRQPREWLLAGHLFSPRELTKIEGAFATAGLSQYEIVDRRVMIPRAQRAEYVAAVMKEQALPARLESQQRTSSEGSFLENSAQRAIRQRQELEEKLASSVRCMQGIEDARVHIDEATLGRGFHRENRVTAMVVVQPSTSSGISPRLVRSIRELVAGAKVEMKPSGVTVTDLSRGMSYSGTVEQDALLVQMDEYALRKRQYEQEWNEKLHNLLQFIPGVQITTNIELSRAAPEPDPQVVKQYVWPRSLYASFIAVSVNIPEDYCRFVAKQRKLAGQQVESLVDIETETREIVHSLITQLLPETMPGAPASRITVMMLPGLRMNAEPNASLIATTGGGIARKLARGGADLASRQLRQSVSGLSFNNSSRFLVLTLAATGFGLLALFGFGKDLRQLRFDSKALFGNQPFQRMFQRLPFTMRSNSHEPVVHQPPANHSRQDMAGQQSPSTLHVPSERRNDGPPSHRRRQLHESLPAEGVLPQTESAARPEMQAKQQERTQQPVIDDEMSHVVKENPEATAKLLQEWLEKAA